MLCVSEAPTKRRVEVYKLKYVNSDNEEIDLDHNGTTTHAQYAMVHGTPFNKFDIPRIIAQNSLTSAILEIMIL